MPDIAMCYNQKCPYRTKCYRFMATPSDYQTFGEFKWDDGCDYYIPLYKDDEDAD